MHGDIARIVVEQSLFHLGICQRSSVLFTYGQCVRRHIGPLLVQWLLQRLVGIKNKSYNVGLLPKSNHCSAQ